MCKASISTKYLTLPEDKKTNGQFVFLQASCNSTDSGLDSKRLWGLLAAMFGVLMLVIFAFSLRYIYAEATIDTALDDMDKTELTDFTVEGNISDKLY